MSDESDRERFHKISITLGRFAHDIIQPFGILKRPESHEPHIAVPEDADARLHYGPCPQCNSRYLRKKGKNAFCKNCGFTISRAILLRRAA